VFERSQLQLRMTSPSMPSRTVARCEFSHLNLARSSRGLNSECGEFSIERRPVYASNPLQPTMMKSEQADEGLSIVHDVLRLPGKPLDAATRALLEPRFGHDFSRVRVHADAHDPREIRLLELGHARRLPQEPAGETYCDVSKGTPTVEIKHKDQCTHECTERHENVHKRDMAPCCKKANKAYKAAKTDEKKDQVNKKMNGWLEDNQDWLQCRGYAETLRCYEQFVAKHCDGKKTAKDPEQEACCVRLSSLEHPSLYLDAKKRRDKFCKEAKKDLTPCPF
jgi:hypothetical protein